MKKRITLILAVFMILSLVACGGTETAIEPTPEPEEELLIPEPFYVEISVSHVTTDAGTYVFCGHKLATAY